MRKHYLFFVLLIALISCTKQELPESSINIPKTSYIVEAEGGLVEIYLQSSTPLDVMIDPSADWVQTVQTKAMSLDYFTFQCTANPLNEERTAKVTFVLPNTNLSKTVQIKQSAVNADDPRITSFSFLVKDNPEQLLADVHGTINADSTISIRIPYILVNKKLIPHIEYTGKAISHNAQGSLDFAAPVKYAVDGVSGDKIEYTVLANSYNGLPVMTIETENRFINPDKEIYVKGTVTIDSHTDFPNKFTATTRLKGRGNATWGYSKKPFRLKLDEKASIFNMPSDKDWVLLPGYCDKSLIRLDLFFEVSRILKLQWTPRMQFVDMFINGKYEGNYMVGEHVKTSSGRLSVDENNGGMLIERDPRYVGEPVNFVSKYVKFGYSFKTPDPDDITVEQVAYSKNIIDDFELRLYSPDYKDPQKGYRAVIDVENFAAWWLVNNICKNIDMNRYYYKYDKQSLLSMGPVWDAEWSFGIGELGKPASADGLMMPDYFLRLCEDEYFMETAKTIWNQNKAKIRADILNRINSNYQYLIHSQESNFVRWNILADFVSIGNVALSTYNNEVQYVKDFFIKRYEWLDGYLNK